jgi:hypothetical protein
MEDYVRVGGAPNEAIADLLRQRLEEFGIACVIVPGDMSAVAGAGATYTVTVPPGQADEAREVLGT